MAAVRLVQSWPLGAWSIRQARNVRSAACRQSYRDSSFDVKGSHPVPCWRQHCRNYSAAAAQSNADPIIRSPFRDLTIPSDVSLIGHMFDDFGRYGNLTALVDGVSGRKTTYSELQSKLFRVASALWRLGIRKGDVVTLFSENSPEFLVMFLSLAAAGAVVSAVNPVYTPGELAHAITHSKAKLLIASTASIEVAKQAANAAKFAQKDIVVFGEAADCRPFSTLLQDDGKCFPDNLDWEPQEDLVALPFSSGTTGLPKGVMLTHYNLVANVDQTRTGDVLDYESGEDVLLGVLPWFHIYGQVVVALAGLKAGTSLVSMPKFSPELFLELIKNYKPTFLHVVPPIMLFLAKHGMVDKDDFSSVHTFVTAAASCGLETSREVRDRLGIPRIRQAYGLTESSPITHVNPRENYRYETCGFVVPNTDYKVVDISTGENLGRGLEGEVCIRGPQIMKGYLNNEEATRKTVKDGWLFTGDVGLADHDGHMVLTDRIKELIKFKGFQVAPAELEALLVTHPAVADSAVIGQRDERAGEVPRGYVVLKPNLHVSEEELLKFIAEQVAPYKQLRGGIEFRKEIPKSASGKILRRILRDELAERS
ncbi:4-coumarate--CoA ligase 1 [Lamellibrachia satsuma]|nr:4-coumarate--CoA ligase 1 [Lamellibrachia satsuma]